MRNKLLLLLLLLLKEMSQLHVPCLHTLNATHMKTKLANFVCFEKTRIIQLSSFGITHNKHFDKVVQFRVNTDNIHFVHGRLSPF